MRIALDTNVVLVLLGEKDKPLRDPDTGREVERLTDRMQRMLDYLQAARGTLIIPTPVLAEAFMKYSPEARQIIETRLQSSANIEIVDFDAIAAHECADLLSEAEVKAILSDPDDNQTKAKLKFDRQILAICKARNCAEIISHDKQLLTKARSMGIIAKSLSDFEPVPEQQGLWSSG
ncbi:PIN domain-containing protein [Spongiibacter tropicus]|uniref:PIN domain-containing protein n=1 Tax=Spongiibacter tropicus TaxID=454602 RepID=UPI0003B4E3AC|nr:PIN domain-containing protein [Spongiibacter tropicus]